MDYRYIRWEYLLNMTCPCLFKCIDGFPISFYFHIDNSEVKKKFEDLVIKCGGQVVENYVNMTPLTAFMVHDKCVRNIYNRVSFKASYVIDCIKYGCLRHINDYIHSNIVRFRNKDYMDVIFLRKSSFTEEQIIRLNEQALNSFNDNNNDDDDVTIMNHHEIYRVTANKGKPPESSDLSKESQRINVNASGSGTAKNRIISQGKTVFSEIMDSRKNNLHLTEKKCSNPCVHCSISPRDNLTSHCSSLPLSDQNVSTSKGTNINENQDSLYGKHCHTCKCTSGKKDNVEPPRIENQVKNKLISKIPSSRCRINSSSSSEESISSRRISNSSSSDSDHSNVLNPSEDDGVQEIVSSNREAHPSGKNHENINYRVLSEEEDDIVPPSQSRQMVPNKHTRKLFSVKEQELMLKYIIKKDAIHLVGGTIIWKKMERSNICPLRTWMSLSNHFRKTLINELVKFPFLTEDQIKSFRK